MSRVASEDGCSGMRSKNATKTAEYNSAIPENDNTRRETRRVLDNSTTETNQAFAAASPRPDLNSFQYSAGMSRANFSEPFEPAYCGSSTVVT